MGTYVIETYNFFPQKLCTKLWRRPTKQVTSLWQLFIIFQLRLLGDYYKDASMVYQDASNIAIHLVLFYTSHCV